jgi:hypothetical protein
MIILADKPTSCLNWPLIARDKFPPEFNNANVKEDFELLFQEQLDPVKLKDTLRQTQRPPNQVISTICNEANRFNFKNYFWL